MEEVIPELVKTDAEGYKAVSYEKITAVLVEALKEQQRRIEVLEKALEEMRGRIK